MKLFLVAYFTSVTIVESIECKGTIKVSDCAFKIEKANNEATWVFIWLGADLLIVLFIIFSLSTGNINSKGENIVYVERESSKRVDHESDNQNIETQYKSKLEASTTKINQLVEPNNTKFLEKALSIICNELEGSIGTVYKIIDKETQMLLLVAGYAFFIPESKEISFELGEGLAGQVGKSKKATIFSNVPENYLKVTSGLGNSTPTNLIVAPLIDENTNIKGVIEIASFKAFSKYDLDYLNAISNLLLDKLV